MRCPRPSTASATSRRWRMRPTPKLIASAGRASAAAHTSAVVTCDPGAATRTTIALRISAKRAIATTRTGFSVRRMSGVAPRMRSASRTRTAAKMRTVSASRSGRRAESTQAGSERDQQEGVARAAGLAAGGGRGDRVAVGQERRGQVEEDHHRNARPHERAVDPAAEAPRREGQDEVDERDLQHPAGRAADAVEDRVVGLREVGHEPAEAGEHQEQPEALVRAVVPRVGPHAHRRRHDQRAAQGRGGRGRRSVCDRG